VRLGGGLGIEKKRAELAPLIEAVVEETRLGTGRTIVAELMPVTVEADLDRLGQVVSNLLNNAAKHGDREFPIKVSLRPIDGHVEFIVENRAEPISPDQLEKLFEPFVQGKASTREGIGLGLFISREVMRAHGGTLVATSSPEGTVRFTATMPIQA
jgi:signal transduction histidine kinase